LESLARSNVFSNGGLGVIGAIAMWGAVIQHANGARSEFAYPARLRLVCSKCIQGGRAVDPTVVVGIPNPLPLCERHARGVSGPTVPADRVQAELLATYAVDVLPPPTIPKPRPKDPHYARDAVSMVVGVLFMVLRGVISAMFLLWLLGLALMVVSVIVGGVMNLVHGRDAAPPPPSAVSAPAYQASHAVTRAWLGVEPHRGAPLVPNVVLPCGVGHGSWVEVVSCRDPDADLLGFGVEQTPHGKSHDCMSIDDAYSAGDGWWICWFDPLGSAWVHPWPRAADPFAAGGP
jgi:hypothetical protein